jgi:GDP-L-fucose synthase
MGFWRGRRVLVTGGTGFVGSHLVERLVAAGARVRTIARLRKTRADHLSQVRDQLDFVRGDLTDLSTALDVCRDQEVVFNLAAKLTGLGWNMAHSGDMFYWNVLPQLQVMEAARRQGVERFLVVSSACVYPREAAVPTQESQGLIGHPEPTNLGYGWSKRVAEAQAVAYSAEYPMRIGIVRPYNTYGPRDDFAWETSHVIPALIRKAHEHDPPIVWGNGQQSRSFIYVRDLVDGMMRAIELYPQPDALNLGADEEVRIRDLMALILEESGIAKTPVYDTTKPAGYPRRHADNTKAREKIGFVAATPLREGIRQTIAWYRKHQDAVRATSQSGNDF